MPRSLRAILIVAAVITGAFAQDASVPGDQSRQENPIRRVAIIGASATAGFGVVVEQAEPESDEFAKTMMDMQDLYMAADDPTDLVYLDLSSHMFFRRPVTYGTSTVDRVLSWEPDLVLGVDYLFWFVYGTMPEESRLEFLEKGLTLGIWDRDEGLLESDDMIGKVKVDLAPLEGHSTVHYKERLKPQGTLVFSVSWEDDGAPET